MENNDLPIYGCYHCGYVGSNFTKYSEIKPGIRNLVCPQCQKTTADPIKTVLHGMNKELHKLREEIQILKEELTNLRYIVKSSGYRNNL